MRWTAEAVTVILLLFFVAALFRNEMNVAMSLLSVVGFSLGVMLGRRRS